MVYGSIVDTSNMNCRALKLALACGPGLHAHRLLSHMLDHCESLIMVCNRFGHYPYRHDITRGRVLPELTEGVQPCRGGPHHSYSHCQVVTILSFAGPGGGLLIPLLLVDTAPMELEQYLSIGRLIPMST